MITAAGEPLEPRGTDEAAAVSASTVTKLVMPSHVGAVPALATLDDDARPNPVFGSATTAAPAHPRREAPSQTGASRCLGLAGKRTHLRQSAASLRECGASGRMAAAKSAQPHRAEVAGDRRFSLAADDPSQVIGWWPFPSNSGLMAKSPGLSGGTPALISPSFIFPFQSTPGSRNRLSWRELPVRDGSPLGALRSLKTLRMTSASPARNQPRPLPWLPRPHPRSPISRPPTNKPVGTGFGLEPTLFLECELQPSLRLSNVVMGLFQSLLNRILPVSGVPMTSEI
jgi:hypothetical protein